MPEKEKAIVLRALHTLLIDIIGGDAEYVTSEDIEAAELYARLRFEFYGVHPPVREYDGRDLRFDYVTALKEMQEEARVTA